MQDDDLNGFEKYEDSAWFAAIRKADRWRDATLKGRKKSSDLTPLVCLLSTKLFNSDGKGVMLTQQECELLIDLLSCHDLQQKPGGRKVPAYKRASWADLKLEIAAEGVRYLEGNGCPRDEAIKQVARTYYVREDALRLFVQQRLHPDRQRRRAKQTPKK
jgi:hypothetical protein